MSDSPDEVELIRERLSDDPSEELIAKIASHLAEEFSDSFPELSRKSRPFDDIVREFREQKLQEVSSEDQYNRKIDYIQTYLQTEVDVATTEDLRSEDVQRYQKWRKYDSLSRNEPLADNTLQDDMYLFREFICYMVEHRMVPVRFEKCVEIPEMDYQGGEGVDEKTLDPEVAQKVLEYLRKYEYASVEHVSMELMCGAGPRKSGLRGLDVSDFDYAEGTLSFEHRETTPLKNDGKSEREITLYGQTPDIIRDYLDDQHPNYSDAEGRIPLLIKGDGRISSSMLQKIAYMWTRPCAVGLECPHDRQPEHCEAARSNNYAYRCPSSRAPHHIRTGYITDQRNRGVSPNAIEQRCDVSQRVQDRHYDLPDTTEERKRFEDEFRDADDDSDSGFNH